MQISSNGMLYEIRVYFEMCMRYSHAHCPICSSPETQEPYSMDLFSLLDRFRSSLRVRVVALWKSACLMCAAESEEEGKGREGKGREGKTEEVSTSCF